ncbi:MAG: hypothetical protein J0H57_03920, partial [Rhodospirillales bacterium]|nr:hypothetical protein [Rhodospirillales bacterium]
MSVSQPGKLQTQAVPSLRAVVLSSTSHVPGFIRYSDLLLPTMPKFDDIISHAVRTQHEDEPINIQVFAIARLPCECSTHARTR